MRKALLALLLVLLLPGIASAQPFVRYYPPPGVAELTSSGTAITSTLPLLLPDGSAAAPSLAFSSATQLGFYHPSGNNIQFAANGNNYLLLNTAVLSIDDGMSFAWSTNPGVTALDLLLARDAANTLALRNAGTAGVPVPQTFNVYNFCDGASCATGYERGSLYWSANNLYLAAQFAGTGVTRNLYLGADGGSGVYVQALQLTPSGNDSRTLGASSSFWSNLYLSRSIQGSKSKALTEGAATTVATVAVPQTAGSNFAAGEVRYTVYASDGTDSQALNGSAFFSAVNKAGTETCQLTDDQIGTEAASAGTLVCTVACATGLTDVVGITFDCTSSLTQTTLNALVRFDMQQPNTLVFP